MTLKIVCSTRWFCLTDWVYIGHKTRPKKEQKFRQLSEWPVAPTTKRHTTTRAGRLSWARYRLIDIMLKTVERQCSGQNRLHSWQVWILKMPSSSHNKKSLESRMRSVSLDNKDGGCSGAAGATSSMQDAFQPMFKGQRIQLWKEGFDQRCTRVKNGYNHHAMEWIVPTDRR